MSDTFPRPVTWRDVSGVYHATAPVGAGHIVGAVGKTLQQALSRFEAAWADAVETQGAPIVARHDALAERIALMIAGVGEQWPATMTESEMAVWRERARAAIGMVNRA